MRLAPAGVDEAATAVATALPDAQITVLEGQQHMAMDTAPDRLADAMLAFFDPMTTRARSSWPASGEGWAPPLTA